MVAKERVFNEDKKKYVEARGGVLVPRGGKKGRLREGIKEWEVRRGRH